MLPVRWVHSSELEDPTAWLKGGELILTTGMGVGDTVAKQRAYVRRLVDAGVAGLGLGLGFGHDKTPKPMITEATKHGFPLFEVPYPVPFIAITEAVFTRLLAEQYDTLQRAVDAEHVLTRAVLDGAGVDGIAASLATVVRGWALLLDLHGMALALAGDGAASRRERIWDEIRTSRPDAAAFSLTMVDEGHHVWVQPVGAQGRVEAFLAVGTPQQPSQLDRIVAGHALSLFAIELAKSRAVAEAERRLQGDFFDELVRGDLPAVEAARGLTRYGFARDAPVLVVAIESVGDGTDPTRLGLAATDHCSRLDGGFLVSAHAGGISVLLPAVAELDLAELVKALGHRVDAELRGGAGGPAGPAMSGVRLARLDTPCRCAGLRGGSTQASNSSGRTGSCSAWPSPTPSALSPTRCWRRWMPTTPTTAGSSCRACRRSCSTTPGGRPRRASCSCTATRCGTGCGRWRSSPVATCRTPSIGWSSGSRLRARDLMTAQPEG